MDKSPVFCLGICVAMILSSPRQLTAEATLPQPRQDIALADFEGKAARTATGPNRERLEPFGWDVRDLAGKQAALPRVDHHNGGWEHLCVAQILQTDESVRPLPEWEMGPFVKLAKPVLSPTPESKFQCPILDKEVRWEEQNVYNPAAVVRDGRVYILYRADDINPQLKWGHTCRIGLASSEDGIHFTRHPTPVLYPDNDPWKKYEWEGGCEDLHIVEGEDGVYYMNYTTWNGHSDTISVASSRDLMHWTKHGPAFRKATPENVGGRSGVVITRLVDDRLIAAKINGKYWMYFARPCYLAWSENLIDWTRADKAVAGGHQEAGAIALLRDKDIVLMFNTQAHDSPAWTLGQALIDRNDMTTVLKDANKPFFSPELDWEKKGFAPNTTVANTLVPF